MLACPQRMNPQKGNAERRSLVSRADGRLQQLKVLEADGMKAMKPTEATKGRRSAHLTHDSSDDGISHAAAKATGARGEVGRGEYEKPLANRRVCCGG